MEINSYSKAKQSSLYKTALSKYEASFENVREPKPLGHDEKATQQYNAGKTVKGEIVDLRYQEVKIRLEPGGQVISAKVDGNVPLYIGQKATFAVSDKSDEQITLRFISSDHDPTHDLVYKALNAAGLAASDRNVAIVRELLNFQMPVDKETILKLIKFSASFPDADIKTLILLLKNDMPVNAVNIAQLELYQKGMHQILDELNILSASIGIYLEEGPKNMDSTGMYNADPEKSKAADNINGFLYTKDAANNLINSNISVKPDVAISIYKELQLILNDNTSKNSLYAPETPINQILSSDELTSLHELIRNILNDSDGNMNHSDILGISGTSVNLSDILNNISILSNTDNNIISQNNLGKLSNSEVLYNTEHSGNVTDHWEKPAGNWIRLKDIMNLFFELSGKGIIKPQSYENTYPSRLFEAFLGLSDTLSKSDKEKLIHIFKEFNYPKQIVKAMHNRWTIKPDNLKDEIINKKYFRRLYEDLENLKELTNNKLIDSSDIKQSIAKLQDNLQFIRDLNDLFLYLQLPLRLARQDAHGDLYVFTRKNKAIDNKEQLSILLHLDMINLGPVDVHMTMKNRQINAVFYLEKASEQLISAHLNELTGILQNKGYQFQALTKVSESKPDYITDILKKDVIGKTLSRYTFDIRA